MVNPITESEIEQVALDILAELGYKIVSGPDIAPDGDHPERKSYSEVVLIERLGQAIDKFNPTIPKEAREQALKLALRSESQKLIANNHHFHQMLVNGVDIQYR